MPKLEISKVHDAYRDGGECPLCWLMDAGERSYLRSFQGSRVMEPNVRVKTNESGFCRDHYKRLYRGENKLGLGLVVHTHLQSWLPRLRKELEDARRPEEARPRRGKKGEGGRLGALLETLKDLRDSCFICAMLAMDLDRYVDTILDLWKEDKEFRGTLLGSRGFCIEHFRVVAGKADEYFREADRAGFLGELVPIMIQGLERLERGLYDFTQLFQDANRSLGTEEQRTALLRALQKLAGCVIGSD
jgi:hypothetical protein